MSLRSRVHEFSALILNRFKDADSHAAEDYQRRMLFAHASNCHLTAESYWLLRDNEQFADAAILCRVMMERVFTAMCASSSDDMGVRLLCSEIISRIKKLEQWIAAVGDPSGEMQKLIPDLHDQLAKFHEILGTADTHEISIFEKAKLAGTPGHYRTGYFELSSYVHGGYNVSLQRMTEPHLVADYYAYVAPVHTAHLLLHHLSTAGATEAECEEYAALCRLASQECLFDVVPP